MPRALLRNALNASTLLSLEDLGVFDFGTETLHWKLFSAGGLLSFHLKRAVYWAALRLHFTCLFTIPHMLT